MYIDDFIWLPDIVEKLAVKHHVTQDEVEEVFFNRPYDIVLWSRATGQVKMCMPPVDRRMQDGT
jgi:hypothetical protein